MVYNRNTDYPENIEFWPSLNLILSSIGRVHSVIASQQLTHWGRVTHICVSKLTVIGSDNGSVPGRRQAIIWTNAGILLIGPLGRNFSEFFIEICLFSFKKMHFKMSSANCRPFYLGLNVLIDYHIQQLQGHNQLSKWVILSGDGSH